MATKMTASVDEAMSKLVESFHAGKKASTALKTIQRWLQNDGWDDFLIKGGEDIVINLAALAQNRLIDSECRCYLEIPNKKKLRDTDRIRHARTEIAQAVEECDGIVSPTALAYPVSDADGRSIVIGALIEIHGQLGPEVMWCGVHASREAFSVDLRANHFYRADETDSIPKEVILSLWDYDEE